MANRIATIDLGSNAVRLLISSIDSDQVIHFEKKIRTPLRLGKEVFSGQSVISKEMIEYAQFVFKGFSEIIKSESAQETYACATSAFREASNKKELCKSIEKCSGIQLKEISGDKEAELVLLAMNSEFKFSNSIDYLLFDIGGGSIELSRIKKGERKVSQSFKLGTVRWLQQEKKDENEFKNYLRKIKKEISEYIGDEFYKSEHIDVIGTGGNFRSITKLNKTIFNQSSDCISLDEFNCIYEELKLTSYLERLEKYSLKPDRADVLLPALKIIKTVLSDLPVKKIFSSELGLVHGIALDYFDQL